MCTCRTSFRLGSRRGPDKAAVMGLPGLWLTADDSIKDALSNGITGMHAVVQRPGYATLEEALTSPPRPAVMLYCCQNKCCTCKPPLT